MKRPMNKKRTKKKRRKLTEHEIEQRAFRKEVRFVFNNMGFQKVVSVSDKEFTFNSITSDFDDVFIYHNIIILTEYTLTQSNKISDHLKPKKIVYDAIMQDSQKFLEFYEKQFPTFLEARDQYYDLEQCKVAILYCSKNTISPKYKEIISNIHYLDFQILKYFKSVSEAIKHSTRYEFFSFLGFSSKDIAKDSIKNSTENAEFKGSILPHTYSNFEKGYKVVSFYVDPNSLLKRAYVLRKDGWKDEIGVYQRMIIKNKILAVRKYLITQKRVFINNLIVTLPNETKVINDVGDTVDMANLTKTQPVTIQIPTGFNVIGIIDGQHRIFAYHEGGDNELEISKLRDRQNLLVTGIIYPKNISKSDRTKFEANLFLEINSNQTNAKSDLKQAIGLLLKPFSSDSIGKALINRLNDNGPLEDVFERHFYDKDKIKTTSIVSYGLKPLVKLSGTDSFFFIWGHENKDKIKEENDEELLKEYIDYCFNNLRDFFIALKLVLGSSRWQMTKEGGILSTTAVIGFIICFRKLIEAQKYGGVEYYKKRLKGLTGFDFNKYKSSQYGSLAQDLYQTYFQ